MVRYTRSGSSRNSRDMEEDEELNEDLLTEETTKLKLPLQSDMAYNRKFLIAAENFNEKKLYKMRHPRSSTAAMYAVDSETVEEVLRTDDPHRSFFYGNTVIEDGSITMLCPIHPLFLVLPYLLKKAKKRYIPLDEMLVDEEFPAISLLCDNPKVRKALFAICKHKEVCGTEVWQYNEPLVLEWLEDRFERLKKSLLENASLHKAVTEDDGVMRRYTYSVLCDYLPQALWSLLKAHLQIRDPDPFRERQVTTLKRKVDGNQEIESYYDPEDAVQEKKSAMLSPAQKRLQSASKGTKSLLGFFSGKK